MEVVVCGLFGRVVLVVDDKNVGGLEILCFYCDDYLIECY